MLVVGGDVVVAVPGPVLSIASLSNDATTATVPIWPIVRETWTEASSDPTIPSVHSAPNLVTPVV